jgi:hypothetical protein
MSAAPSIRTLVAAAVMVALPVLGTASAYVTLQGTAAHPAGQVLAADETPDDTPWGPGSGTP